MRFLTIKFTGLMAVVPHHHPDEDGEEALLVALREGNHSLKAATSSGVEQGPFEGDFSLTVGGQEPDGWSLEIPHRFGEHLINMTRFTQTGNGRPDRNRLEEINSNVSARFRLTEGRLEEGCMGGITFIYKRDMFRPIGRPVVFVDCVLYSLRVDSKPVVRIGSDEVHLEEVGQDYFIEIRNRMTCDHWRNDHRFQRKLAHACRYYQLLRSSFRRCAILPYTADGRRLGDYDPRNPSFFEVECGSDPASLSAPEESSTAPDGQAAVPAGTRPAKCPLALLETVVE